MVMSHIEKLFPNKKIKYVCPSHHHPDHAGGIAKYINHGVTVITTKNNTEYFTKISKRNHHFVNYNNTLADKPVFEMVPNGGSKIFKDDTYSFTCYEVGNEIEHTKEYLVTYFPKERILLVADLIQFPISAPKTSFGNRGKALVSLIEKEGLRVDKIYTSWPLKGQKEFGTFTELKKGIPD
jgi:flavorubredoxin